MINFLKETVDTLHKYKLTLEDVVWIGTPQVKIDIEKFKELADQEYDDRYYPIQISRDLLVVGKDWWLERRTYEGFECWEFKRLPKEPAETIDTGKIIGNTDL